MSATRVLFWFRRDLRLADNHGLMRALEDADEVIPVFVFDRTILHGLPTADRRVDFIHGSLAAIQARLVEHGASLTVLDGDPRAEIPRLAAQERVDAVYANEDYEPAAIARDVAVAQALGESGIRLRTFKDTVLRGPDELLTQQRRPYTVFTPYRNAWRKRLQPDELAAHPSERHLHRLARRPAAALPSLAALGFAPTDLADLSVTPGEAGGEALLRHFARRAMKDYAATRDLPAADGGSRLSVHNRFGTVSIRALMRAARAAAPDDGAETWLDELIWREFYFQLLYHFPDVVDAPFRPQYANIAWDQDEARFAAWCEGRTGYPIVDAAMRELNTTGTMHNRLRMVTASFLVKDLLVDWRRGERYFARQLLDYDLAQNNGNWQWAASTGCDPQPYFRIFNPARQSAKFDPAGAYIKRYVPELAKVDARRLHAPWEHADALAAAGVRLGRDYPWPVVDHAEARARALAAFKAAIDAARAPG